MSKKRRAAESSSNEQTNEDSDPVFQHENNAKRAKLTPLSDIRLTDLPIELIQCILVKAVVLEVKSMKMAKCAWKEKADLVISRLRSVCSLCNNILTTNFFRNEVHKLLDGTAQVTNRLEILHQSPIQSYITRVAAMKDEVFMLCTPHNQESFINVHDRNNMADVKDVIPLPGIHGVDMVASSASNCVYVLSMESHCHSVLCVKKDVEHHFHMSPYINDLRKPYSGRRLFASVNGSLVIISYQEGPNPILVSIYNANGFLQHEIMSDDSPGHLRRVSSVIQKSNGNLVLGTFNDLYEPGLKEIDMNGKIVRQYQSSVFRGGYCVTVADATYGRIAIIGMDNEFELLDSELNLLSLPAPLLVFDRRRYVFGVHYNSERNEIVRLVCEIASNKPTMALTILRFAEE